MNRKGKNGLDDVYVVGCGPSLLWFDWSLLEDRTTIAVNGAIRDVPHPDYFITADSYFARRVVHNNFYSKHMYKVLVMGKDHKHFKRLIRVLPSFDCRIEPNRFDGEIGFDEYNFCTGQNSGFCGMQLAVVLGAKTIHLLGIDCNGTNKGNYHGLYNSNPNVWDEFYTHFVTAIGILCEHNIQVISHSPTSRLNKHIEYRELI